MTAIAAVIGGDTQAGAAKVSRLLARMAHRGDQPAGAARHGLAAVGAVAYAWEANAGVAAPSAVVEMGGVIAVADASLYYLDVLMQRLGLAGPPPGSPQLILHAYQRWGREFPTFLEGDFACVVVDARRDLTIAARDHVGRRPLHYTVRQGQLTVGSLARAVGAVVAAPLNAPALAAAVGGLLGGSDETGFTGVFPVPAGGWIEYRAGAIHMRPWSAPVFRTGGKARLEESSEELRHLLTDAVRERTAAPRTAVWLSGGADSTAVFGAGQADPAVGARLAPVSISYPEGDSAREDDYIKQTAARWHAPVTWIDSESVSLFEHLPIRVAVRDDPYAHTFEAMNLRLAATSADLGAHVAFDGYGGDQLFHVSDVWLAEYLVRGRWRELREALAEDGDAWFRVLVSRAVFPWLPPAVRDALDQLRGRVPDAPTLWRQGMPDWLSRRWRSDPDVQRRALLEPARRLFEGPAAYESRWYVETPYFPRASAWAAGLALQRGVLVRSPLLDRRVLDFAASRPLAERAVSGDTKLVLKAAMRGLIPEGVLAPRKFKTGVPRGYIARRMESEFSRAFDEVFSSASVLAELGLIDLTALRRAQNSARVDHLTRVHLFLTLQAELWVRSVSADTHRL